MIGGNLVSFVVVFLTYVVTTLFLAPPAVAGGEDRRDSLLHPPDARPRTPPRGLAGSLEPPAE